MIIILLGMAKNASLTQVQEMESEFLSDFAQTSRLQMYIFKM